MWFPAARSRPSGQDIVRIRIRTRLAVAAVCLAAAAAACASEAAAPQPSPGPTSAVALPFPAPSGVSPAILAPLDGLGPCPPPPTETIGDVDPATLGLPPIVLLTSVEEADPLTNVQGWVDWTPVQLRIWYQHVSGLDVVQAEDEVFESEVLLNTDDDRRLFVKAQAICATASIFVAIVAPGDDAGSVPVPAGSPAPPG